MSANPPKHDAWRPYAGVRFVLIRNTGRLKPSRGLILDWSARVGTGSVDVHEPLDVPYTARLVHAHLGSMDDAVRNARLRETRAARRSPTPESNPPRHGA
ncbi:hypothetical protein GCM10027062_24860 [Nocardioides hungaricus]